MKSKIKQYKEKIQVIIRANSKNLYYIKLENQKQMCNFLHRYHLPKLNQDHISNLNRSITLNEMERVIKLSQKENPRAKVF